MQTQLAGRDTVPHQPGGLLNIEPEQFRSAYNRRPFMFQHRLQEHPLMQLEALIDLANRLPADQVRHSRGKRGFEVDFDADLLHRRHRLSLDQVLDDVRNADAYVMIHRPDTDPLYRDFLFSALADVRSLVEQIDPGMCDEAAYIFIASPGAVTPYHMDREMNFLCQVSGTKAVQLWNQDDRSILTAEQLDVLFARPDLPKPAFKPEYEAKAMRFTLEPGTGVHQPFTAPHAVVNGDEISIAIALTFRSRAIVRRIAIHQANYRLRRMGIDPGAYGRHPLADSLKHGALRGYHAVRAFARPARG
ncbi:MAG: cupin-like domain-containing protein [Chloroflexota bacterium]|nr:cupin-like domain-containing protein [Chloroflexota bacterium]